MFYNRNLMNSTMLGEAWRAGNRQVFKERITGLPKVCDALNAWLDSAQGQPSGRLSLRVSAIFVNGITRLYKEEVGQLFEDCRELEMNITLRNHPGLQSLDNSDVLLVTEEELEDTEHSGNPAPVSRLSRKRRNSRSYKPSSTNGLLDSMEDDGSTGTNNHDRPIGTNTHDGSYQREVDSVNELSDIIWPIVQQRNNSGNTKKIDKEVQTNNSYIYKQRGRNRSFNEDLPFGLVLIHDTYNDRLPSKIIFSSLNSNVKHL